MPNRQPQKKPSTPQSHSYIFSDASRALYRQESLSRKLKHLQQENIELEQKIKQQEQEIKDERTVIIYQMGQLVKAVSGKLGMFQERLLTREMFVGEGKGEGKGEGLRVLMGKYEDIEKEALMIGKVRGNMEKMYEAYTAHKESIQKIMQQSTEQHQQSQQKIRQQILQKRQQVEQTQSQNTELTVQISQMRQQLLQFQQDEPQLQQTELQLLKEIEQKQKDIERQSERYAEMSKWEEIVVDRKMRMELAEGIKGQGKRLGDEGERRGRVEIALREQELRVGAK